MCDSLYVKANGEMPCWDDVGESRILRRLSFPSLLAGRESDLFSDSALQHIRTSFMNGRVPHPGLCESCAVLGHHEQDLCVRPASMNILHVEPSYLCHLSCPQCISAAARKGLVEPPYNMPPEVFQALLVQLKRDGIQDIRIVHFEGRGDPLVNPGLGSMVKSVRELYPGAETMVTTHASYPYRPWLVSSGLHVLRLSVDGARAESYARYRWGGDFGTVIRFMTALRDDRRRSNSTLKVYWKYILFEWNDSDEEMEAAARMAKELDVSLVFVLTHTPGRSLRFTLSESLQTVLDRVAPEALIEQTFPLRQPDVLSSESEICESLGVARNLIRIGDDRNAVGVIAQALERDCGQRPRSIVSGRQLIYDYIPLVLESGTYPAALAALAEIVFAWGRPDEGIKLLRKYLRVATDLSVSDRLWLALRLSLRLRTRIRNAFLLPKTAPGQKTIANSDVPQRPYRVDA